MLDKIMIRPQYYIIGLAMFIAVALAVLLKPQDQVQVLAQKIDLETIIPKQLGDWNVDQSLPMIEPSADVQASLRVIYSQTLSRTYVNSKGYRIMLSIAYGDGFDKQLDVHRPEYCYRAQGFEVGSSKDQIFESKFGHIPLRRLVAQQGQRVEPISYWVTIGGETVSGTINRKMIKIRHMLTGHVDSGMLVRVSSIDPNSSFAYANQEEFINAFVKSIAVKNRKFVISIGEPR